MTKCFCFVFYNKNWILWHYYYFFNEKHQFVNDKINFFVNLTKILFFCTWNSLLPGILNIIIFFSVVITMITFQSGFSDVVQDWNLKNWFIFNKIFTYIVHVTAKYVKIAKISDENQQPSVSHLRNHPNRYWDTGPDTSSS